jgi:hypothetical protein
MRILFVLMLLISGCLLPTVPASALHADAGATVVCQSDQDCLNGFECRLMPTSSGMPQYQCAKAPSDAGAAVNGCAINLLVYADGTCGPANSYCAVCQTDADCGPVGSPNVCVQHESFNSGNAFCTFPCGNGDFNDAVPRDATCAGLGPNGAVEWSPAPPLGMCP